MLVRNNKHFFLYLSILILSMQKIKTLFIITILFATLSANGQCDYNLDNYSHINCYGDNTGAIDITLQNSNTTFWWTGVGGFTSASANISNLIAGDYVLHLMNNLVPGDTSTTVICYVVDSITIEETLQIDATFELSTMCNENDSTDVVTSIWGGTPPYVTLWSTGDTARNTDSLAPSILPYQLFITDANNCTRTKSLTISVVSPMNPFMSSVAVICKDDNTGSARVFVTKGTTPFQFQWSTDSALAIQHDSFSVLEGLFPGEYHVKITDAMGCVTRDTIEVKSNPTICITVYKVFSPNDDNTHEFWEIENINLYPEALVQVYDRTGRQVYNRRNYINAEEDAFAGKDQQGRILPSGTYYYIIDLENEDTVFKGVLTIVR
jgi:gliding motility-associated-like protein